MLAVDLAEDEEWAAAAPTDNEARDKRLHTKHKFGVKISCWLILVRVVPLSRDMEPNVPTISTRAATIHSHYRLLSSSCRDTFIHALQFFSLSHASHRLLSLSYRNGSSHALPSTRYIRPCVTFIHAPAFLLSSHVSATKPRASFVFSPWHVSSLRQCSATRFRDGRSWGDASGCV